jgi:hypothetical protein
LSPELIFKNWDFINEGPKGFSVRKIIKVIKKEGR